jgi:hypothetical protein
MTHGRSTGDTTLADGADGATIGGAMTLRTRWSTLAAGGRGLTSIVLAMLAVGSACGAGQHLLRRPVTMQELTVPKPRLPEGCSLKVIEPPRRDINPVTGGVIIRADPDWLHLGTNPWTGTDRSVLAEIRQHIDGMFPLPDAPPLTATQVAAFYADGIDEGYAATYTQSGGREIALWAVRFAVPKKRTDFPMVGRGATAQNVVRIEIGAIRAVVDGDGGPCSNVIVAYLEALGR